MDRVRQPKEVEVRRYIRRPSAALVVACVALLVALGGTSVAAVSQLARSSVGTLQLRDNAVTAKKLGNNAVTTPKLANNAVTASKVRNGSLLAADFAEGQIPAGPHGPAGPQGPPGAQGQPGPQGRWAHVLATGVIAAQSGGITVAKGAGPFWFVTFTGATVTDRPLLVSASRLSGTIPPASIEATPCGEAPQGMTCSQSNTANTVLVNASADTAFYVMAVP